MAELDDGLRSLRDEGAGTLLDQVETTVWGRINAFRSGRASAFSILPAQGVAIGLALVVGLAGGGLTAAAMARDRPELSPFAIHTSLAPSTLLDRD